jgi:hypothetical protein
VETLLGEGSRFASASKEVANAIIALRRDVESHGRKKQPTTAKAAQDDWQEF